MTSEERKTMDIVDAMRFSVLYAEQFENIQDSSIIHNISLKAGNINIGTNIKKVIFNNPATIIIWKDGTKTVVKCGEGEIYDPEKGFAIAVSKYVLGNNGRYYETFKKYLMKEGGELLYDGTGLA